jgi:hypothetical protein
LTRSGRECSTLKERFLMRYRITVEWNNEDGSCNRSELGEVERGACVSGP